MKYSEFAPRVAEHLAAQAEDIAPEDRFVLRAIGRWQSGILNVEGAVNTDGSKPTSKRAAAPYIAAISSSHVSPADRSYAVYVAGSSYGTAVEVFAKIPAAYDGYGNPEGYIPIQTEPMAKDEPSLQILLADGHPDIMMVNGDQVLTGYICDVLGE